MYLITKRKIIFFFIILLTSILIPLGCGEVDKEEGCPATLTFYDECTVIANAGDKIIGPADETITFSAGFQGGSVLVSPLIFVVQDASGNPRNNVCVNFFSDGFFWADRSYSIPAPNSTQAAGAYDVMLRTNDRGVICAYWSTESLPMSGSADVSSSSFINANSGTAFDQFLVKWTVKASTQ